MIRIPAFPLLVQVVIAGTFLARIASAIVWPFLSVILIRQFRLPPAEIGLILAGSSVAGSVTAFYLGNLSDRFGRRTIMIAGCVGTASGFVTLATADTVFLYTFGAVLVGLSRSAIESPGSALISETIADQALRELAFHTRYFLANVGYAIGPLIGFFLGLATQQTTFFITASTYLLLAIAYAIAFRKTPEIRSPHARHDARLRNALRTLNNDRRFLMLMLATFLAYVAYSQVESTLVQHVNQDGRDIGVGIATAIVAVNGLTIIVFQFPLLRLLRPWDLYMRIYAGMALFVLGFMIYVVSPSEGYVGWILGTWILSMGEAILFPTLSLQSDRMAPEHLRGSYFGAMALSNLGFAAGPLAGGAMLQAFGGPLTFLLTALVTMLAAFSYWQSSRVPLPARI
jgi:MFS family permease